jgi:hypothetical protein
LVLIRIPAGNAEVTAMGITDGGNTPTYEYDPTLNVVAVGAVPVPVIPPPFLLVNAPRDHSARTVSFVKMICEKYAAGLVDNPKLFVLSIKNHTLPGSDTLDAILTPVLAAALVAYHNHPPSLFVYGVPR